MAKWGEGDPRWIVEERADATNVNNWHWTERDATNWSSEKLKELLMGLWVEGEEGKCEITEVSQVEGEASINNRKGKLIFFYEWNLKAAWRGTSKSGIIYKGNIEVPNLSDENDMDDLDVSCTTNLYIFTCCGITRLKALQKTTTVLCTLSIYLNTIVLENLKQWFSNRGPGPTWSLLGSVVFACFPLFLPVLSQKLN
ncbi:activator of 90 kDa heat shock protein ATPase homolog 1-like [Sinocyclocheilus grahami]|uniref:activator of 90 kDa heat shock protein ATPase homolog 1-like n=1 Tax=Sinocyclocheilus grahami TaxID=75366 RepID=UPI0007ACB22C|nr:PREDICTED: activator of 90 kDa heat shock protein ATPase homolog 1-like [Sinocyclocheilus grahami]